MGKWVKGTKDYTHHAGKKKKKKKDLPPAKGLQLAESSDDSWHFLAIKVKKKKEREKVVSA